MKKVVLVLIVASFLAISCNNEKKAEKVTNAASIYFKENSFDFGKVSAGEKVNHDFTFINNGTEPLIISEAIASCGCTVPEFPKEPIAPKKSGTIKVIFHSEGREGMQHKVITITSNSNPAKTEIYLTGEVKASEVKK